MKVLIATGIYPPAIGGPAMFAQQLSEIWSAGGTEARLAVASRFNRLPSILRKVAFTAACLRRAVGVNAVLALDTFSAGLPAYYITRWLRKPLAVRVGGDFLWEAYVQRTGRDVTLAEFCRRLPADLSARERTILSLTRKLLRGAELVAFSTGWYAELAAVAYGPFRRQMVIDNPTGPREAALPAAAKSFLLAGRDIRLKNVARFRRAFAAAKLKHPELELIEGGRPRAEYLELLRRCYAVAVPSLSEITPNAALDAIRYGKPLILTRECGYAGRFGKAAVVVDPRSEADLQAAVERLADEPSYREAAAAASSLPTDRTFVEVAADFLAAIRTVCG